MTRLESLKSFVIKELGDDSSGHNHQHCFRVLNNALKIQKVEGGDLEIVIASAILHDCIDKKLFNNFDEQLCKIIRLLKSNKYSEKEIEQIIYIIQNISWNNGENKKLDSVEAMIVRDADRLDAIGAMGIIRTIAYGTTRQRLFYEDANLKYINNQFCFDNITETTLSHFYEKLLLLKDLMHTKTGKALALKRHKFLEAFLKEFYNEL